MRTRTAGGAVGRCVAGALMLASLAGVGAAAAQTPYVPYYGKNLVRWNKFDWHIYKTEHFEIFYYPEIEKHLERVAAYAESAYQQVSSDLKHDLAFRVPMIIFKTHSEFEQQNVIPGAAQEGVAAFAESTHDRMLLPLDEPSDLLFRTITHELTHIFQFDIIPQSLIRRNIPLWVSEGHADYEAGYWAPFDLATVRDAAVADIVPKMSQLEEYGNYNNPRIIYDLGHAAFEFIESRWGREGVRQFLFALRKSVIGGGENAYDQALRLTPEEFDQQFEKYLKDRFKPFRDKERPADYGRELAPSPEKSSFSNALTVEPSPSGELLAVVTGNRNDREIDIVLVSARDGSVVRNLTGGFDKNWGWSYLAIPGTRWNTVPWLSWGPSGDRLAYFVRTEDFRSLIIHNVVKGKVERRIPLKTINEPESPTFSPDGRVVAFSGLRDAKSDIYAVNLESGAITNLTNDEFADFAPAFSPDGTFLVYMARVSGNEKLFRLDLATGKRTQLTFGTHDDAAARFIDQDTIVFPSTAADPTIALDPDVVKNGVTYNLWTLDLKTGELKQYTDSIGGTMSPVVLRRSGSGPEVAFVTYYKGDYGLHTMELKKPIHTVASADFGAPGPIIDFQAPLTHTLVRANARKKGTFEKLFLEGRPPINVGVTSSGDFFGGTAVSFADVLGDHRFDFIFASISQYRTFAGSYVDLSHRLQWAVQGFSQSQFYYGQYAGVYYDPAYVPYIPRDQAIATRTQQGGSIFGIYPLNTYRRLELSAGLINFNEHYNDASLDELAKQYQTDIYGRPLYNSGTILPLGIAFVQETTVFREFGPLAGNTVRLAYDMSPGAGSLLSRQTVDLDARLYKRIAGNALLALRARGFRSWGAYPDFTYFGGNSEMRGYDYLQFVGQNAVFGNAELRFPLIEAMLTPVGILGGIRGVLFFNIGAGWWDDTGFQFWTNKTEQYTPLVGYDIDPTTGFPVPVYGAPVSVSGFRLVGGRASYGIGLETFALGFPIHFDWSWRTLFDKTWENLLFGSQVAADQWRKGRFQFWIGYDF